MTSSSSNNPSTRQAKALALAGLAIASHASTADGAVIYSNTAVTAEQPHFDDPDTLVNFSSSSISRVFNQCNTSLRLFDQADNFAWVDPTEVMNLSDLIGASNTFSSGTDSTFSFFSEDQGVLDFNRYVGFRWENQGAGNNETWYGWARVQGDAPLAGNPNITVVEFAYDNSGNSITAGAVPEPGSVLLLGAGLLIPALRRRRGME